MEVVCSTRSDLLTCTVGPQKVSVESCVNISMKAAVEAEMKWHRMSPDGGFNPHQIKGGLMAVRSCRKEVLEIHLKPSKWSCCSVKVEIIRVVIKL